MLLAADDVEALIQRADEAAENATFPVSALELMRQRGILSRGLHPDGERKQDDLRQQLATIYQGAGSAALGIIASMHLQQVHALVRHASAELRRAVLPGVARGENYIGSVTTERASGGDLRSSNSTV